jgi:hypothetical protein
MRGVRIALDAALARSKALRRAIAANATNRGAEDFDELAVIDIAAERALNGVQIGAVRVRS